MEAKQISPWMRHHQKIQNLEDKQISLRMGLFPTPTRKNFSEELGKFKIEEIQWLKGGEEGGKGVGTPFPLENSLFLYTPGQEMRDNNADTHTPPLLPLC